MSDAEIDDGTWVSMAEAARRLRVTRQAIRGRIDRGTLQSKARGNRGLLVKLPATLPAALPETVPATLPTNPFQRVVDAQREEITTLRERVARLETAEEIWRERLARFEATDAMRQEQIADLRAERDRLIELARRLSEPLWRRWFRRG